MKDEKPKVLDLFAGCGGMSKGFEQAGFEIVAANEFWKPAQETYKKNHPETRFFPGDITSPGTKQDIMDFFKNRKCDVLIGGPPCQAYSNAGLRNPNDPRGKLFEDYVKIVERLQPKVFVMENVKGILNMKHDRENLTEVEFEKFSKLKDKEKEKAELLLLRKQSKNNSEKFKFGKYEEETLKNIKEEICQLKPEFEKYREPVTDMILGKFRKIGYEVRFELLNSADYGVPQKRERVIFIGTKRDVKITHPEPTHCKMDESTQTELVGLKPWVTVREVIDDLKDKEEDKNNGHVITHHSEDFLKKLKDTPIGKSVFGNYSDAFFRNPPDEPSRTVKENHGGVLVHYEKDRVMTPRELARLQSFPDDFIFKGSKSMVLKQIGNAVPPGLGEAIGIAVKRMLGKIDVKKPNQDTLIIEH